MGKTENEVQRAGLCGMLTVKTAVLLSQPTGTQCAGLEAALLSQPTGTQRAGLEAALAAGGILAFLQES